MRRKKNFMLKGLLLLLCVLLPFSGCGNETVSVSWFDTTGELIRSAEYAADCDPTEEPLPTDTDIWHYTGWTVSKSGRVTVCTATRVRKTRYAWVDYDGTLLKEAYLTEGEDLPSVILPKNSDRWVYSEWEKNFGNGETVYTAQRVPNKSYFVGNVFQIVVMDASGTPLGAGSGFVINRDGWFITNNHVMEDGYSAVGFFDIKDVEAGAQYTKLDVMGGVYYSKEKDFFIGKLSGYEKIESHYQTITFTEGYEIGQNCYSVGYPNSSVKIEINAGKITEEYSNIQDKINGIYYILADCYIAPGSSGGVLINENFDVIGLTTIGLYADTNKEIYLSGGSIPTLSFRSKLTNLNASAIKSLSRLYER